MLPADNGKSFAPNEHCLLNKIVNNETKWVTQHTAILVVHGIGYQLPYETIDQFGRGLVKQYKKAFGDDLQLKHEIVVKPDSGDKQWFDNVLRLSKKDSPFSIDVYEYYWANYTEDKASWSDINTWLHGVVKGANKFYKRNSQFGKIYKDKSIFFDTRSGDFLPWRYRLFLTTISQVLFGYDQLIKLLIFLFSYLPFVGNIAAGLVQKYANTVTQKLTNLLVDIVAYNVIDPKSKFYSIRSQVLDGAVKALQYLLEKSNKKGERDCEEDIKEYLKKHSTESRERDTLLKNAELTYPQVIVAAHSLGTQVSFDAINRINLMINKEQISTYTSRGECRLGNRQPVSHQLKGFVTFGSHLDKVVFFLRENIPDENYLRQQFMDDFHGFKQREVNSVFNNSSTNRYFVKSECGLTRFFDDIQWRNYYDDKDYVSGGLDYYTGLTNINCQFKAGTFGFTHSYYWDCEKFFADVINNFLQ